ncbi:MAG TPA: histidine kinase dimerization/phosphoacceptor domain -containing protein [Ignavibacteriaceae bacterium]|nr:histidine kinase dimerization/phosphoacceptor domain -containing protein [Ignavibacteriaceae bacterium]
MKFRFYHFIAIGIIIFVLELLDITGQNDWLIYCLLLGLASKFFLKKDIYLLASIYFVFVVFSFIFIGNFESQTVQIHIRGIIIIWFLTYVLTRLKTEHQKEVKLRKEQESIYNRIDELVFGLDTNWRLTYKNSAADKIGYKFINIGDNFFDKLPKTMGTEFELHIKQAVATQKPVTFTYQTQYSNIPRTIIFTAYPSEEGLSIYTKDITKLKQAQEIIEKANERINFIINRMSDAFWAVDKNYCIVYANDKMIQWTGKSKEEVLGNNLFLALPLLKNSVVEEKFKEALETQQNIFFEMKSFYVPNTYFSLSVSPSEEGLTVYAKNISDYREAKIKLQKALEEKNILFRELNHRIKNSLQIVTSIINIEANQLEDIKIKSIMDDIIKRIYSISLVHSKLHEVEALSHLNLSKYIKDLVSYLVSSYEKADFSIELNLQDINIDVKYATYIGMIINELISNSIKYAHKDKSHCIICINCSQEDSRMSLVIQDNGIGYPNEIKEKDTLGILLVKHFVEQMDAVLIMENRNGAYTEIIISNGNKSNNL